MTFSFRRNLDIRHRLPDRMGQGVAKMAGDIPLVWGFYAPKQRVTASRPGIRGTEQNEKAVDRSRDRRSATMDAV